MIRPYQRPFILVVLAAVLLLSLAACHVVDEPNLAPGGNLPQEVFPLPTGILGAETPTGEPSITILTPRATNSAVLSGGGSPAEAEAEAQPPAMPAGAAADPKAAQAFPYLPQPGTPTYIANFAYPDRGCAWSGIAGQVFGPDGREQKYLVVKVTGVVNGANFDNTSITGNTPVYGPGGYEIDLDSQPVATTRSLWIQLFDQAGKALSDRYYFDTYADCQKAVVVFNFQAAPQPTAVPTARPTPGPTAIFRFPIIQR